jgi:hypothetical protein
LAISKHIRHKATLFVLAHATATRHEATTETWHTTETAT